MTTGPEISNIIPPISNKPNVFASPTLPYQSTPQPTSSVLGPSNAVNPEAPIQMPKPTPIPSSITPGQLLQSQPSQIAHKDVEVVQVSPSSPKPLAPVASEAQPPILPLPPPARVGYKNGVPFQTPYGQSGREKGRGAQVFQIHGCSNQSFRRPAGNDEDEDDDDKLNGAAATGTKIPSKSTAAATKAPPKPKKPQALKLLSFADGDAHSETQPCSRSRPSSHPGKPLSSSSSSHKISSLEDRQSPATPLPPNVLPQAGTYTKEALRELQKNTKTLASWSSSPYAVALESYADPKPEFVIVLKGLVRPNSIVEQTLRQMDELSSDEEKGEKGKALEEKRDVLYRDDVDRWLACDWNHEGAGFFRVIVS
ncbi:hypothetical protein NL676_007528 [Syzygium grande]|nr:hypothetical protein NL676_007528 [Syzygium grande]